MNNDKNRWDKHFEVESETPWNALQNPLLPKILEPYNEQNSHLKLASLNATLLHEPSWLFGGVRRYRVEAVFRFVLPPLEHNKIANGMNRMRREKSISAPTTG